MFIPCKYKWIYGLVVLFFCSLVIVAPVSATALSEKLQEQAELDRRLDQEKAALKQQKSREAALREELSQLDQNIKALQEELARLASEIDRTEEEIAVIEAELADARERLEKRDNLLKRRLRAIYEHGSVSYVEVLLNAGSFTDFLTRLYNLQIIAENDRDLLEEVKVERARIETEKEKLEEKRSTLVGMRRQTATHREEVEFTLASRAKVHGELQEEIASQERAIREMEQEAAALNALIQQLLATSSGNFCGLSRPIAWPVEVSVAYLTSPFGSRYSPITGVSQFHGGIDIGGLWNYWPLTGGAPAYILAADSGRVIFSGISEGGGVFYEKAPGRDEYYRPQYWTYAGAYGSMIIIDHGADSGGQRWSTVYAHCHARLVATGDTVYRGQRIAIAGSTGSSTGPHLHFEVRQNDNRVDPLLFLK